ncbi:unnamed protein product [marine sediment metagenome]|uniref:Uncharacterized protein n=1 Tax=marine sediment metagenome TaxID=412755 RepID=X1UUJ4_9ZZZZ
MTTKECLEELIKLLRDYKLIDGYDKENLINALYRGQGDSS